MEKSWRDIFGKKTRLNWLESEVDILRRELDSYKHFRKKDDERNYEKITKCIAKTAFVEVQIEGAVMPLKNRIGALEQQIADGMNREEEWKRRLSNIENRLIADQMKEEEESPLEVVRDEERCGFVLKKKELEPRVGDLVVRRWDLKDIRKVEAWGFGLKIVGKDTVTAYTREALVDGYLTEWKVIARWEDLK